MLMTVYPWPETIVPLRAAGFEFPHDPVDVPGDTLIRLIQAGFDVQVRAYRPHQTHHERERDGEARVSYTLQISPAGRGFGQR